MIVVDGQHLMMNTLKNGGFNVPKPIPQLDGKLWSIERINEKSHLIRLLSFLPGTLLKSAPITDNFAYNCGAYIAKIQNILSDICHDGLENYETNWSLSYVRKFDKYINVVQNEKLQKILKESKKDFLEKVYAVEEKLPKGLIHADLNDQNILIENDDVHGLFDFGDAQKGPYVYDLAICIFYLTIECKRDKLEDFIRIGRKTIQGYETIRKLKSIEKETLPYCILARYVQSLASAWWMKINDPENEYAWEMINHKYCNKQLIELANLGKDKLESVWFMNE